MRKLMTGMCLGMITMAMTTFAGDGGWSVTTEALDNAVVSFNDMVVTEDRHVFLLSVNDQTVVHLDENGKFVSKFGNRGQGAGEFGAPYRLQYFPASQTLLVADGMKRKMIVFKKNGDFIEEYPVLDIQMGGYFFFEKTIAFTNATLAVDKARAGVKLYLSDFTGKNVTHPDAWNRVKEFSHEEHGDPQTIPQSTNFIRFPWTPKIIMAKSTDDTLLFVGSNAQVNFSIIDTKTQEIVGTIKDRLPRHKLTDTEVNAYLTAQKPILRRTLNASQFQIPDYKTAMLEVFCDYQNRLWVKLYEPYEADTTSYVVYNKNGSKAGTLEVPARIHCVNADEHHVWARMQEGEDQVAKKFPYKLQ